MAFIQRTIQALWQAGTHPSGGALEIFEPAIEAGKDRRLLSEALDLLRVWLRDVLLCHEEVGRPERLVNIDRIEELHAEAARLPRAAIIGQLRALEEAQAALRGNVHPTLALENLCLSMRRVSFT
jgi:DNA polymerase-3 subunit delta'